METTIILYPILCTLVLSFKNLSPVLLTMRIFIYFKDFAEYFKTTVWHIDFRWFNHMCGNSLRNAEICSIKLDSHLEIIEGWPDESHSSGRKRVYTQKFSMFVEWEIYGRRYKETNQILSQYKEECSHDKVL